MRFYPLLHPFGIGFTVVPQRPANGLAVKKFLGFGVGLEGLVQPFRARSGAESELRNDCSTVQPQVVGINPGLHRGPNGLEVALEERPYAVHG